MEREKKQSSAVSDIGAWALNVVSSVGLIMANKQLMSPAGYAFVFGQLLFRFFLHFRSVNLLLAIRSTILAKKEKEKSRTNFNHCWIRFWFYDNVNWVPLLYDWHNRISVKGQWLHHPKKGSIMGTSLVLHCRQYFNYWDELEPYAEFSWLLSDIEAKNGDGFLMIQISKLSMIPVVCVMEWILHGKQYSSKVKVAVMVVVVGVGVCTVTDVKVNAQGFLCAFVAVLSTSLQQISIGSLQKKYAIGSFELLSQTAPIQAVSLLLLGPFVDYFLTGNLLPTYHLSSAAFFFILVSCSLAVFCNISQYLCIGRFSAVSFQVLGHMKTVCVLTLGWLLFDSELTFKNILGMAIAVLGMVLYSWAVEADKAAPLPKHGSDHVKLLLKQHEVDGSSPFKDVELGVGGLSRG
ncbi:hypothetical protein Goshw_020495 [Gossypium schwendimanii]|uniref:Sugar phosphate transporter domain-containing protein n=1 Tax=Gossypium schwendimanii TaxID=34291 RepID=A0A7J9MNS4_GOSSC|nr:hypothetical protein [Gossypium schwendimanii]